VNGPSTFIMNAGVIYGRDTAEANSAGLPLAQPSHTLWAGSGTNVIINVPPLSGAACGNRGWDVTLGL